MRERTDLYDRRNPLAIHKLEQEGTPSIRVRRRDVLKAVAASVIASATSALTECVQTASANDRLPIANRTETAMNSRPLMTVRIVAAPPQKLGTVPHGIRNIVPVTDLDGKIRNLESHHHRRCWRNSPGRSGSQNRRDTMTTYTASTPLKHVLDPMLGCANKENWLAP